MDPDKRERRIAGLLFFATCCSVYGVSLLRWSDGAIVSSPDAFRKAFAFTFTLMGILLGHEMGHYVVALRHGFQLGLPWFLPAPMLVGTFGAVIRLREAPRNRAGLVEMGAAGPLAGLVVVVVALIVHGLTISEIPPPGDYELARPVIWRMAEWIGVPHVPSAEDPIGFACWIGCLLTAMNLIPFGQLDGGHVLSAVAPRYARRIGTAVTGVMLIGGFVWVPWAVWAVALHLMGTRDPLWVRHPEEPLERRNWWVLVAVVIAFALCFTPVPLMTRE